MNYLDNTEYASLATNIAFLMEPVYGRIGAYTANHHIYKCPGDKSWILISDKPHPRVRSYSMNQFVGQRWSDEWRYYGSLSDLTEPGPAKTWAFAEQHEDSIVIGLFPISVTPQVWHGLPSSRHNGSGVFSFLDGHVEFKKFKDPRTLRPVERIMFPGFVSPGNVDREWVFERSTRKINRSE